MRRGTLEAWVEAGESGPAITLAGEADLTGAGELGALIAWQLVAGTWQLTVDVSRLRFADAASIRPLALAGRSLAARGGRLVVLDPRPSVARVLALLGVDHLVTIRETEPEREPGRTRKARDERGSG